MVERNPEVIHDCQPDEVFVAQRDDQCVQQTGLVHQLDRAQVDRDVDNLAASGAHATRVARWGQGGKQRVRDGKVTIKSGVDERERFTGDALGDEPNGEGWVRPLSYAATAR